MNLLVVLIKAGVHETLLFFFFNVRAWQWSILPLYNPPSLTMVLTGHWSGCLPSLKFITNLETMASVNLDTAHCKVWNRNHLGSCWFQLAESTSFWNRELYSSMQMMANYFSAKNSLLVNVFIFYLLIHFYLTFWLPKSSNKDYSKKKKERSSNKALCKDQ